MSDLRSEPCPSCGSTGCKRWQMLSGQWVCDECWLDVAQDIQYHHFSQAQLGLGQPVVPKASRPPASVRRNTGSGITRQPVTSKRPGAGDSDALGIKGYPSQPPWRRQYPNPNWRRWRSELSEIIQPRYNSYCLLCGHIYYGAVLSTCSRCGGNCVKYTDDDMTRMVRYPTMEYEKEKS
jgi:hypothetical protein